MLAGGKEEAKDRRAPSVTANTGRSLARTPELSPLSLPSSLLHRLARSLTATEQTTARVHVHDSRYVYPSFERQGACF